MAAPRRLVVSTTVTADAYAALVALTERKPYHATTDVVSAALVAFGKLDHVTQADQIAAVRAHKHRRQEPKKENHKQ